MMFGLLFSLLISPAWADSDKGSVTPITVDAKTEDYVPMASGSTLTFSTTGPNKFLIKSRRRMAGAGQRARPAPIEVRGDGNPILTIQVPGSAIADGRIHDRLEGFPSKEQTTLITVPEGGKTLSLTAPPGGPDFFVRVTERDQPAVMLMAGSPPVTADTTAPNPVAKEAPRSGEADPSPESGKPIKKAQKNPPPQNELQPGAGLEMGLGVAARGTEMVFHIGATGRYPIHNDLLSVGGSIGWHRIAVESSQTTTNPLVGTVTYDANWRTDIIPIIARVTVHVPYPPGPVTPLASLGLGGFIATRTDGTTSTTHFAVGPELATGLEFGLPVGLLQTTVSWSEARAQMGNKGIDGAAVAETLAVTRLNLAYLYVF